MKIHLAGAAAVCAVAAFSGAVSAQNFPVPRGPITIVRGPTVPGPYIPEPFSLPPGYHFVPPHPIIPAVGWEAGTGGRVATCYGTFANNSELRVLDLYANLDRESNFASRTFIQAAPDADFDLAEVVTANRFVLPFGAIPMDIPARFRELLYKKNPDRSMVGLETWTPGSPGHLDTEYTKSYCISLTNNHGIYIRTSFVNDMRAPGSPAIQVTTTDGAGLPAANVVPVDQRRAVEDDQHTVNGTATATQIPAVHKTEIELVGNLVGYRYELPIPKDSLGRPLRKPLSTDSMITYQRWLEGRVHQKMYYSNKLDAGQGSEIEYLVRFVVSPSKSVWIYSPFAALVKSVCGTIDGCGTTWNGYMEYKNGVKEESDSSDVDKRIGDRCADQPGSGNSTLSRDADVERVTCSDEAAAKANTPVTGTTGTRKAVPRYNTDNPIRDDKKADPTQRSIEAGTRGSTTVQSQADRNRLRAPVKVRPIEEEPAKIDLPKNPTVPTPAQPVPTTGLRYLVCAANGVTAGSAKYLVVECVSGVPYWQGKAMICGKTAECIEGMPVVYLPLASGARSSAARSPSAPSRRR